MSQRVLTVTLLASGVSPGLSCCVVMDPAEPDAAALAALRARLGSTPLALVNPPHDATHAARLTCFGNPLWASLAGALALAQDRAPDLIATNALRLVLEVGDSDRVVDLRQAPSGQVWVSTALDPTQARVTPAALNPQDLGLASADLGFDNHEVSEIAVAGQPVHVVPVATQAALAAVTHTNPNLPVLAYTHEVADAAHAFHVRLVSPAGSGWEAGLRALAAAIVAFDHPTDGTHTLTLGCDMGTFMLDLTIRHGHLVDLVVHASGHIQAKDIVS